MCVFASFFLTLTLSVYKQLNMWIWSLLTRLLWLNLPIRFIHLQTEARSNPWENVHNIWQISEWLRGDVCSDTMIFIRDQDIFWQIATHLCDEMSYFYIQSCVCKNNSSHRTPSQHFHKYLV